MTDFFISYTSKDEQWADSRPTRHELLAAGDADDCAISEAHPA